MRIKVIAFATAGEALAQGNVGLAGPTTIELELPAGANLSELRRALAQSYPKLDGLWPRLAVAVDGALVQGDAPLHEGCEVALLPPVSGGSPSDSSGDIEALSEVPFEGLLTEGPIDVAAVEHRVSSPDCGAVLLFLGSVRNHHRGRAVSKLTYDAYRPMAQSVLEEIARHLESGSERLRATIVHRLGEVPAGEVSVVIAIASPHRQAAYEASRIALERLKKEAPIWKREHYADGEAVWREEEPLVASSAAG